MPLPIGLRRRWLEERGSNSPQSAYETNKSTGTYSSNMQPKCYGRGRLAFFIPALSFLHVRELGASRIPGSSTSPFRSVCCDGFIFSQSWWHGLNGQWFRIHPIGATKLLICCLFLYYLLLYTVFFAGTKLCFGDFEGRFVVNIIAFTISLVVFNSFLHVDRKWCVLAQN